MHLYGNLHRGAGSVKENWVSNASSAPASAAQRLESELKRAIVSLEIPPGSRLSEADVAERHGVSRQPAREALISLARSKLVEVLPQRGTTIAKISVNRMMQARFVREAVETAVVRRAASHFDPIVRERISSLLETQEQFARADDHVGFQRYDELFHIALAEGAGCPLAWEAVRDLKTHMDRLCKLTLSGAGAMLRLVDQHRAIAAAIDANDADEAEQQMREHLTEILRALPRVEAEYADFFE